MPNQDESQWTLATLKYYLEQLIMNHETMDLQRHLSEHTAVIVAQQAMSATLLQTQLTTNDALRKAEVAIEKRFDSVNEFRAQLGDQARTFLPRPEFDIQQLAMGARIAALEKSVNDFQGRKSGVFEGWGWAVGIVSLLIAIMGAVLTLTGHLR